MLIIIQIWSMSVTVLRQSKWSDGNSLVCSQLICSDGPLCCTVGRSRVHETTCTVARQQCLCQFTTLQWTLSVNRFSKTWNPITSPWMKQLTWLRTSTLETDVNVWHYAVLVVLASNADDTLGPSYIRCSCWHTSVLSKLHDTLTQPTAASDSSVYWLSVHLVTFAEHFAERNLKLNAKV